MSRRPLSLAVTALAPVLLGGAAMAQHEFHDGHRDHRANTGPARNLRQPEPFRPGGRGLVPGGPPHGAWDPVRHNGFWYGGRWYYGPPPTEYGLGAVRPGRSPWRRGGYLPSYYRGAVITDFARYRLRRPPYGYRWIYAGGDYMLVAASSGVIFDVIPGS